MCDITTLSKIQNNIENLVKQYREHISSDFNYQLKYLTIFMSNLKFVHVDKILDEDMVLDEEDLSPDMLDYFKEILDTWSLMESKKESFCKIRMIDHEWVSLIMDELLSNGTKRLDNKIAEFSGFSKHSSN